MQGSEDEGETGVRFRPVTIVNAGAKKVLRLTVEVPMFSSSSAAAMPPQSTTVRNTRSRRKSMSLICPKAARLFGFINC